VPKKKLCFSLISLLCHENLIWIRYLFNYDLPIFLSNMCKLFVGQGPVSHYSICSYSVCYTTFRGKTNTITTYTNEKRVLDVGLTRIIKIVVFFKRTSKIFYEKNNHTKSFSFINLFSFF